MVPAAVDPMRIARDQEFTVDLLFLYVDRVSADSLNTSYCFYRARFLLLLEQGHRGRFRVLLVIDLVDFLQ